MKTILVIIIFGLSIACGSGKDNASLTPSHIIPLVTFPIEGIEGEFWAYSVKVDGFQKMPKIVTDGTLIITSTKFWTLKIKNELTSNLPDEMVIDSENSDNANCLLGALEYIVKENQIEMVMVVQRLDPMDNHTYELNIGVIRPGVDENLQGYWEMDIANSTYNPFGTDKEIAYVRSSTAVRYTAATITEDVYWLSGVHNTYTSKAAYRNGFLIEYWEYEGKTVIGTYTLQNNTLYYHSYTGLEKQDYLFYKRNLNSLGY